MLECDLRNHLSGGRVEASCWSHKARMTDGGGSIMNAVCRWCGCGCDACLSTSVGVLPLTGGHLHL